MLSLQAVQSRRLLQQEPESLGFDWVSIELSEKAEHFFFAALTKERNQEKSSKTQYPQIHASCSLQKNAGPFSGAPNACTTIERIVGEMCL